MRVLVTRPKEDAERLATPLRALGASVFTEPMLVIMPVPGPNVDLAGVQAALLTSANGARSLGAAVDRRDIPVFAVGGQTARVARDQGFTTVHSAQGNVEDLALLVADRLDPADGALVHAAGSTRAGDLAGALAAHGFTVRVARLYDARPTAALSQELAADLKAGAVDAAVFFSPRTAKIFADHVRRAELSGDLGNLWAYALSPAVAANLEQLTLGKVRVAERPAQEDLLALLEADIRSGALVSNSEVQAAQAGVAADEAPETVEVTEAARPVAGSSAEDAPADEEPSTDDRTHEDGEAAYGGSAGAGAGAGGAGDDADAADRQAERHTLRTLALWVVALLLLAAGAFGSMPWWKPWVPPSYQVLLPGYPDAGGMLSAPAVVEARLEVQDAEVAILRDRIDQLAEGLSSDLETLASRVEAIEARVARIKDAGAGAGVANSRQTDAAAMEAAVDGTIAAALAPLRKQLADLDDAVAGLRDDQQALADEAPAEDPEVGALRSDLTALAGRVDVLAAAMPRINTRINPGAVALMMRIAVLRDRVRDGRPYADALAPVAADPALDERPSQALSTLSAHADTGISTLDGLRRRFEPMSMEVAHNAIVPEGEDWWEKTLANILSSVTVRRTDGLPTGGTLGHLSQATVRLADNDLSGAVDALGLLEGPAAGAAAEWLADARAHLAVDAALASLTSAALEGIGAAQTME